MKKQTFHQSLSIFTCRIWLHYNNNRGDTRHSYLMDFNEDFSRVNHLAGRKSLTAMIDQYRNDKQFSNVLIYDNINDVCIYDEIYIPKTEKYRIRLNCDCKFQKDEKGNWFYIGYESFDQETGEIILNPANQEKVRAVAKLAHDYVKKRKQMPQILYPKRAEVSTEKAMVHDAGQFSIGEALRMNKMFEGLDSKQLSAIADMLLKTKGVAA